jgi:hypothetical protein
MLRNDPNPNPKPRTLVELNKALTRVSQSINAASGRQDMLSQTSLKELEKRERDLKFQIQCLTDASRYETEAVNHV